MFGSAWDCFMLTWDNFSLTHLPPTSLNHPSPFPDIMIGTDSRPELCSAIFQVEELIFFVFKNCRRQCSVYSAVHCSAVYFWWSQRVTKVFFCIVIESLGHSAVGSRLLNCISSAARCSVVQCSRVQCIIIIIKIISSSSSSVQCSAVQCSAVQ